METLVFILWGSLWLIITILISCIASRIFYVRYSARMSRAVHDALDGAREENNAAMARLLHRLGLALEKLSVTMNSLSEHMRDISGHRHRD